MNYPETPIYPYEKCLPLTQKLLDEVEILAGRGLKIKHICDYYGVSGVTWANRCREYPQLRHAFRMGKAKAIAMVAGELIKQIKEGEVASTIFYLKTQANWRTDGIDIDPDDVLDNDQKRLIIDATDQVEAAKQYQKIMLGEIT